MVHPGYRVVELHDRGGVVRYRRVNQNQTYRHEIAGGYLWSPKRNANKARNPFYESMREVAPGDIIFSFRDTRIAALGIARSYCYESPKPTEFGTAGSYWEAIVWKIDTSFRELNNRIHPKSHIGELRGLLPEKYSPLRANGDGLQSVYLAEVSRPFAWDGRHHQPPSQWQALAGPPRAKLLA
jgi:hypothetical protein